MKFKSVELSGVGGIDYLKIDKINPKFNIICGENGVGKTNILEALAVPFSNEISRKFIRNVNFPKGKITIEHDIKGEATLISEIEDQNSIRQVTNSENKNYLLFVDCNRGLGYQTIHSISSDEPIAGSFNRSNMMCINGDDIKGWYVKRFLYSKHEDTLTNIQQKNLNLAISSFSILDKNFKFKKVSLNHEIIINTPTGDLFFERLSSGYKSIIYIILGLIKEIDYRLAAKGKCAAEFNGIILIDEIETHLHPVWQGKICIALKEIFPKAQFFVTTHSPHVVQTANRNEVISLTRSDNNEVQVRDLPEAEFGYQGWTIEEILKDVMGMPDLRTKKYDEVKQRFDNALDNQNINEAREAYNELDKMLHPLYPLRPVFRMQLDSLGE